LWCRLNDHLIIQPQLQIAGPQEVFNIYQANDNVGRTAVSRQSLQVIREVRGCICLIAAEQPTQILAGCVDQSKMAIDHWLHGAL
jgi:hypothetical protein